MKKLTYIAALVCSMGLGTSCVDLNQEPQSFITEEQYFKTITLESLEQSVTALYNDLWFQNYGFNCRIQRINVCANDITYREAKANNPLAHLYKLTPNLVDNNDDFSYTWELFYLVINNANKIIEGTVIPEDEEEATKFKAVLGEAYFLRGLSYFYLTRMYGKIPLILKQDDAQITMPRSEVKDIYEKAIIPSLVTACDYLPSKSRSGNSSTPTEWAAKACLTDVYLTMAGWPLKETKYYAEAEKVALDIIKNSGLKLTTHYADLWKEANKTQTNEFMFALHHSAKLKVASNYGKSYYPVDFAPNAGWADYYANEEFYLAYPNDERKKWNFMTEWNTKNGIVNYKNSADKLPAISKYYDYNEGDPGKSAQANGLTSIYRYADVLLMYAEASARANGSVGTEALNALQEVQKRAQGYPENPVLTETTEVNEFLKDVIKEREWEFFAEMKRWFDLVRLERVQEVRGDEIWNNSIFKANNHYYFPIPYQQIELTGWENNPGY